MPPPTWLPTPSMIAAQQAAEAGAAAGGNLGSGDADKRQWNTPLAGMLPPELANVDVTAIFPEFRPGKVCDCLQFGSPEKLLSLSRQMMLCWLMVKWGFWTHFKMNK